MRSLVVIENYKIMQPVRLEQEENHDFDGLICKAKGSFFTYKINKVQGNQYQISKNCKYVNT